MAVALGAFDWSLMRSFLAVIEHGSLGQAAKALRSSQPTLGRHVAQLEQQLGVSLFERGQQGLLPTPLAQRLAGQAQAMAQGAREVGRLLDAHRSQAAAAVRISAGHLAACQLLPPMLARLRERHPDIAIELVATDAVSDLLRREADIAVRMARPVQSGIVARRVGAARLGVYGERGYLRRRGEPRELADLLRHDLVGFDADDALLRGLARLGLKLDRQAFAVRCDDKPAQCAAVRAGLGLGVMASFSARAEGLQQVLPDLPMPALPVWLAVHREVRSSPHIRRVYDFLRDELVVELGR